MTARRSFTALAAAVLLAACSALPPGGFDAGSPATSDLFAFGAAGVGGFDPAVGTTPRAVEGALPGFSASPIEMAIEQRTLTGTGVFRDGLQVLQLVPGAGGRVIAVHGVSPRVRGPNGERIGMSFAQSRLSRSDCRLGTGNWRGMPVCPARGAPGVDLVFAIPGYVGDDLPDGSDLAGATLQRMVWTVPGASS